MGRKAKPYIWRKWFVTEAGGRGIHQLCPVADGIDKAEEELDKWIEQCRKEQAEGLVKTDAPVTCGEIAALFLAHKRTTKAQKTFVHHHNMLKRFVRWYRDVELTKLRFSHGTEYVAKLKADGLGNTSINHHITTAKCVLNYAVDDDLLIKNPWKKLEKLDEEQRERIVTDEEFTKLLAACEECIAYSGDMIRTKEENVQLMKDVLNILRFTAMRPGELRTLRWDYIKWERSLIVIPAKKTKTRRTKKDRKIPILEEAEAILKARQARYGHQPFVFPNLNGSEWRDTDICHRFDKLRIRAGLDTPDENGEMLVLYSLRHTR